MGVFERVAAPRIRAAISGQRSDGVQLTGKYRWAGNRPLATGFNENVEFYELQYLDPDDVQLGEQFDKIHPSLWLAAGGVGPRPETCTASDFYIAPASPYAVLFEPARLRKFVREIEKRSDITHVWVVSDSEEAYAEACEALPNRVTFTSRLYHDYLRTFRVNTRRL